MPRARTAQDKRPVQIKLDNATADRLRIQAAQEGTTQSALIEEALRDFWEKPRIFRPNKQ